jgi:hypothetical protein
MKGQNNVRRLLQHKKVSFQRGTQPSNMVKMKVEASQVGVVATQGRSSKIVLFKDKHIKKYKKLVLNLVRYE